MNRLSTHSLTAGLVAALLAGCASLQSSSPGAISNTGDAVSNASASQFIPSTSKSVARNRGRSAYTVSGPLLYVTNFDSPPYDGVTIYDTRQDNQGPIAVINAGVNSTNGACIDRDGTLYVGNDPVSGFGWVSEYTLGTTTPVRIITQGVKVPVFCAIDAHGNLWVTNLEGPTVTEYLKGSTAPHFTLRDGLTAPDGIAIDHVGNIYVGNFRAPYGTSNVQVYPPGKTSPSRTITDGITWPIGIAVDPEGTLYVTNDAQCNIEKYRTGESHPYQTITKEIDGPTAATFARNGRMFEVNGGVQGCPRNGPSPAILEFRPRSLSPSKRMISTDLHTPSGATYYPPLMP